MKLSTFFLCLGLLSPITLAQPLQLHPNNPHIFLYKGKPFVIVGSGEHYGAVLNL